METQSMWHPWQEMRRLQREMEHLFGDFTPATDAGKAIVSFEALLGQIFVVTVVSRLVGLYSRDKPPRADDDSAGSTGGEPAAG